MVSLDSFDELFSLHSLLFDPYDSFASLSTASLSLTVSFSTIKRARHSYERHQ